MQRIQLITTSVCPRLLYLCNDDLCNLLTMMMLISIHQTTSLSTDFGCFPMVRFWSAVSVEKHSIHVCCYSDPASFILVGSIDDCNHSVCLFLSSMSSNKTVLNTLSIVTISFVSEFPIFIMYFLRCLTSRSPFITQQYGWTISRIRIIWKLSKSKLKFQMVCEYTFYSFTFCVLLL